MYNIDIRKTVNDVTPILDKLINSGKTNFGIYTYGNLGQFINKEILKKIYNINSSIIIDNKVFDGEKIFSLEQAKNRIDKETICLICSENAEVYYEVRNAIFSFIPENQVVDLFPKRPITLCTEESEIERIYSTIDKWLDVMDKEN